MRRLLATSLFACLALVACGGDDKKASTTCLSPDKTIDSAAAKHVDKIVVGVKDVGDADKVEVTSCRTSDEDATATVTVRGVRDALVKDQRHKLTLKRKNNNWVLTQDLDTQRCREGHGHQNFSSLQCN